MTLIVKNLFYIFGKLKNLKPEGNWKIGKLTMNSTGKIKTQTVTNRYTTVVTEVILQVCFFQVYIIQFYLIVIMVLGITAKRNIKSAGSTYKNLRNLSLIIAVKIINEGKYCIINLVQIFFILYLALHQYFFNLFYPNYKS